MKTIGIRELTEHINEILHMVKEKGEPVEVIDQGEVLVLLVPPTQPTAQVKEDIQAFWVHIDRLADEISLYTPGSVDATQIVREGRREL